MSRRRADVILIILFRFKDEMNPEEAVMPVIYMRVSFVRPAQ